MNETQIIDFEIKGNVVRFYLGVNGTQWGDDWNDAPYEHNAGTVYKEHIKGYIDFAFAFDTIVLEPADGHQNSSWTKEQMMNRAVPCVVILTKENQTGNDWWTDEFDKIAANGNAVKFYFGDDAEIIANKIKEIALPL